MKLLFDLKSLLTIKKWNNPFFYLSLIVAFCQISHAQNPQEVFSQIQSLEEDHSKVSNYEKPSRLTKDNLISYINKLEIDIDKRAKIKAQYISLEKIILSHPIDSTTHLLSQKDDTNLSLLRDRMAQEVYLEKLVNDKNKSSDIAIKELYIQQLNRKINTEEKIGVKSESNFDSIYNVCIEKIAYHEDQIDALTFEMDKMMKSVQDINQTSQTKHPNQSKKAISTKSSLLKINLDAKKYISSLNQQNLIYQPNFGIDNKTFEDRKGFMNWPLVNSKRIARFQENINNTILKGTILESNDENVQAVAQGMVAYIGTDQGKSKFVIIKHDNNFYTIYSNLKEVYVIQNQTLKYAQSIGIAAQNIQGKNLIQFQIWDNDKILNPSRWLKNK